MAKKNHMEKTQIIETIIEKINNNYDHYDIEEFLERKGINPADFDILIEAAENKILAHKLKTYPKQNKFRFIFYMVLFVLSFLFSIIILPILNIRNGIIPLSIFGAISISLSGCYALLFYKSWNKDFVGKVGKPKFNLSTYLLIFSVPTVLLYFLISWSTINGAGHDLYKLKSTSKIIKFFTK